MNGILSGPGPQILVIFLGLIGQDIQVLSKMGVLDSTRGSIGSKSLNRMRVVVYVKYEVVAPVMLATTGVTPIRTSHNEL